MCCVVLCVGVGGEQQGGRILIQLQQLVFAVQPHCTAALAVTTSASVVCVKRVAPAYIS